MKETVLDFKILFYEFYIALFRSLMRTSSPAFPCRPLSSSLRTNKVSFKVCLTETVEKILDVLVRAELFLYFLYFCQGVVSDKIYDSAIMAATNHGKDYFYSGGVIFGAPGGMSLLLSEAQSFIERSDPVHDKKQKGKLLFYCGIYQLVIGKAEDGAKCLEEAVSLMDESPEHTVLKLIAFQILSLYCGYKNNSVHSSYFYIKALQECQVVGDTGLLVIPKVEGTVKKGDEHKGHSRKCQSATST